MTNIILNIKNFIARIKRIIKLIKLEFSHQQHITIEDKPTTIAVTASPPTQNTAPVIPIIPVNSASVSTDQTTLI